MHLVFLLEEPSAKAALDELVPGIVGPEVTTEAHPFQGKKDLLDNLSARLRGYAKWIPTDWRIVILLDEDRDKHGCRRLKERLESICKSSGLVSKAAAGKPSRFRVVNRIAVEELEAWYFGDVEALCAAYPGVSPNLGRKAAYRNPDAIRGGTWEALERVLQRAGYHLGGLNKIQAARDIASRMDPERNKSRSFQVFRDALRSCTG